MLQVIQLAPNLVGKGENVRDRAAVFTLEGVNEHEALLNALESLVAEVDRFLVKAKSTSDLGCSIRQPRSLVDFAFTKKRSTSATSDSRALRSASCSFTPSSVNTAARSRTFSPLPTKFGASWITWSIAKKGPLS